ncbi:MAG: sugar phosphate isomerase/epimerase family protein [bacterium]
MKILLHSFTFRDYEIEHAIAKGKAFGYEGIELFPSHYESGGLERVKQIIELGTANNLPVETVDFEAELLDRESQQESVNEVRALLAVLKDTGVKRINGGVGSVVGADPTKYGENGSAIATPEMYKNASEGLREICAAAEDFGIEVVLEIHMNTIHDSVASYLRLHELTDSGNLGANFDAGNMYAVAHAEEANAGLTACKDVLRYVHLKNCVKIAGEFSFTTGLRGGDINHDKLCRTLRRIGYDGDICIEYCGEGDPHPRAQDDRAYWSDLWREISGKSAG